MDPPTEPLPIVSVDLMTNLVNTSSDILFQLSALASFLSSTFLEVFLTLGGKLFDLLAEFANIQTTISNDTLVEVKAIKSNLSTLLEINTVISTRMSNWTSGSEELHTVFNNTPTVHISGQPEIPLTVFVTDPIP